MKSFLEKYKDFKYIKNTVIGDYYRFCWIPLKDGKGIWSIIEFFDDELPKIDKNKVEVVCL